MAFISEAELRNFFNEEFYLENNPDVAAAVEDGDFESGFDHYVAFGLAEGRIPSESLTFFSEETYLEANPDVATAVDEEAFDSALDHFLAFGINEGRTGSGLDFFDTTSYLQANPDVAAEVGDGDGILDSALEHYLRFGFNENRGGLFEVDGDLIVEEGDTLAFTVGSINGGTVGQDVPVEFSIAGDIDLGDIVGETLDGTAIIEAGSSSTTFSVELAEDETTEGFETAIASASVLGDDLDSQTAIDDTSVTPEPPEPPTFILSEAALVDEGDTLSYTVATEDGSAVASETAVDYVFSGDIDGDDVADSLSGTATIAAGESSTTFSIDLVEDGVTEGLEEVVVSVSVNDTVLSDSAIVNDTSTNTAPIAADDQFTTNQDTAINIAAADLLGNDTDADNDPLTIVGTDEVENGSLEIETSVALGGGSIEHEGTVTFNEEITVGNFTIGFDEARVAGDASGFFVADTVDLDTILFDLSNPETLSAENQELNLVGSDLLVSPEFAELLGDSALAGADVGDAQSNALLSEATPGNLVVDDGVTSVNLDTEVLEAAAGLTLTGADSDAEAAEGFAVGFDIVEASDFTLLENITSLTFTPDDGFGGVGSFNYTISDGNGGTDTATATIDVLAPEVTAVNAEPTAVDETDNNVVTFTITTENAVEGETIDLNFTGEISPEDIDGEFLPEATVGADGTAEVSLTFLADEAAEGPETVTLEAGIGDQDFVTSPAVTVADTSIPDVNEAPVPEDDAFSTPEDAVLNIAAAELLANDTDPDGDSLTLVEVSNPETGTLTETTTLAPVSGAIEHSGTVTFNDAITVGEFTIGFDAARIGDARSGFFVADNADLDTILFDLGAPEGFAVEDGNLTISGADLLVSEEFASVLEAPEFAGSDLTGADVGDAQTNAVVTANESGNFVVESGVTSVDLDTDLLASAANLELTGADSNAEAAEGFDVGFEIVEATDLTLAEETVFAYDPSGQFDDLNDGETGTDSFTYTVSDDSGATATANVDITIQGIGAGGPETVSVDPNNDGETLDATAADITFAFASGNYGVTIDGFDADDVLDVTGLNGAGVTVQPDADQADGVQAIAFDDPVSGNVVNVTLAGLTPDQDSNIFNRPTFEGEFGEDSLLL